GLYNACPKVVRRPLFRRAEDVPSHDLLTGVIKTAKPGFPHEFITIVAGHDGGVRLLKLIERRRYQTRHQVGSKRLREHVPRSVACETSLPDLRLSVFFQSNGRAAGAEALQFFDHF